MMRVALIIVNYNSGPLLERCLTAVQAQTRAPERILVVDNASKDGSTACIGQRWIDVELLSFDENLGFAAANNRGLERCQESDWVALLNPDAFPEPDWLEALLRAAVDHPRAGSLASCLVQAEDTNLLDGTGDAYHVSGLVWRVGHGLPRDQVSMQRHQVFAACAAAALYKRSALEAVGGFDERYFCYNEDVDLGFRLRLAGLTCWHVPDAVVRHLGSAITGKHSDFSLYHGHRNLVWTYLKDMPTTLLKRYWWQHLLLNLASLVVLSIQYRTTAIFRAKMSALRGLRPVLKQRALVQATKQCQDAELVAFMSKQWWRPYWRRH